MVKGWGCCGISLVYDISCCIPRSSGGIALHCIRSILDTNYMTRYEMEMITLFFSTEFPFQAK
jgi:hypothetical protein